MNKKIEKEKKLKHIKVYNELYNKIQNGTYEDGSQLPSESELSIQMGVSRMTLRQALLLLQEDKLINNIQGKGNFVTKESLLNFSKGLEYLSNPIYECCTEKIDELEIEFRLELPSDAISKCLGNRCAAVVIVDRWYKKSSTAIAYTLTFVPIEVISMEKVDLKILDELKKYVENTIYSSANNSLLQVTLSNSGNFSAQKYTLSQDNNFMLIQEAILSDKKNIMAFNKHYIPLKLFKLNIRTSKND